MRDSMWTQVWGLRVLLSVLIQENLISWVQRSTVSLLDGPSVFLVESRVAVTSAFVFSFVFVGPWISITSIYFFNCSSSTVVSTFLPPLSPAPPPLPLTLNPTHLWLWPWVLHSCSFMTLSLLSLFIPLPSPLGSLSVLYFIASYYILLAYLFCWLGSTYRWDHMVFVPHRLAYFT